MLAEVVFSTDNVLMVSSVIIGAIIGRLLWVTGFKLHLARQARVESEKTDKYNARISQISALLLARPGHRNGLRKFNVDCDRDPLCPKCTYYTKQSTSLQKFGFPWIWWMCECDCGFQWIMVGNDDRLDEWDKEVREYFEKKPPEPDVAGGIRIAGCTQCKGAYRADTYGACPLCFPERGDEHDGDEGDDTFASGECGECEHPPATVASRPEACKTCPTPKSKKSGVDKKSELIICKGCGGESLFGDPCPACSTGIKHKAAYASDAHEYYIKNGEMCGCSNPNAKPPCGFCESLTEAEVVCLDAGGSLTAFWDETLTSFSTKYPLLLEYPILLDEALAIIKLGLEEADDCQPAMNRSAKSQAREFVKKFDRNFGKSHHGATTGDSSGDCA